MGLGLRRHEWLRHNVRCDFCGSTVKLRVGSVPGDFFGGEAQENREEADAWERREGADNSQNTHPFQNQGRMGHPKSGEA